MARRNKKLNALKDLTLSLQPQRHDFTMPTPQPDGGVVDVRYVLKEPTETASVVWRDAIVRATRLDEDGKPIGVDSMSHTNALLLSYCLFRVEDGKEVLVDKNTILQWPSRVVRPLVEAAMEMGAFNDDDDEDLEALEEQHEDLIAKIDRIKSQRESGAAKETLAKN